MHYSHDISLSYNISLIYRTVDDKLEASEDFLGMMEMASCNAKSIVTSIKDILLRPNLPLANCRGQCYDGASVNSGHKSGIYSYISGNGRCSQNLDAHNIAESIHCINFAIAITSSMRCDCSYNQQDIDFVCLLLIKL